MTVKRFFVGLIAICGTFIYAEEPIMSEAERKVPPPPVVSALSSTIIDNVVSLAWSPAEDIDGENIILRLDRPITASTSSLAERRGVVPVNVTKYSDVIDAGKEYYYAIMSRDSTGAEQNFFIPASNSLLVPVIWGTGERRVGNSEISGFGAIRKDDSVILTWTASIKGKNLIIYRATAPFSGINSLPQAVVISASSEISVPFIDYPVPGVAYYYAIIDEDELRTASVKFTGGVNTNVSPVEVPYSYAKVKRSKLTALRPMPLPYLNPSRKVERVKVTFSRPTEDAIAALTRRETSVVSATRVPYVFRSDLESTSGGEEYTLRQIVETNFRSSSWKAAITELTGFLSVRRSSETAARAHFYLGEAYYFSGNYRQGVLEFLLSQDRYYNQSREWIQYVLKDMVSVTGDLSDLPQ
ncbi:MAG TPA: hypothetical protein PKO22_02375 [Treponemataceae bacterium]|nr:hypothetical protein [Treponemataceae bacterium]